MTWTDDSFEQFLEYKNRLEKGPVGGTRSPLDVNRANPPYFSQPNYLAGPSKYDQNRSAPPPALIDDVGNYNWFTPNQPVVPYGPPGMSRPVEWDYPTSYNLSYIQPQISVMKMLRTMRASWGVLSTVISTCKDQLLSIPFTIQNKNNPKKSDKFVDEIKAFFKKPDGFRNYRAWARLVLDDVLVLDTPCLYFPRNLGGKPLAAERIDPTLIFPLIDDMGRPPETVAEVDPNGISYFRRQPAYQQIWKGIPLVDLDDVELMYAPVNPRAEFPIFGYPPTEQILKESLEAILKTNYQVDFWDQGTIPELIVTVPDNWSPNQIAVFKAHFDALMSGNLGERTKMHFLPGGMKPFELRNASGQNLWSTRDETLIRICCYGYSVSPSPFIQMMNRSVAQNAQQASKEEGTFPRMAFWKYDIMDAIIQEKFGYDDIEFVFLPPTEPDGEKREKIFDLQLKNGSRNRNEVRAERGEEPVPGGEEYLIQVGNAVIPLEDAANGLGLPVQGGAPQEGKPSSSPPTDSGSRPGKENNPLRGTPRPAVGQRSTEKGLKSDINSAANESEGDLKNISAAQISAGNYKKGHLRLHGLDISIETPKGAKRGKKSSDGSVKWSAKMPAHYGYIRKTDGADDMQVDVFIGKHPKSDIVWIIDQLNDAGDFDEHKCFIGYKTLKRVVRDFRKSHGDDVSQLRDVVELTIDEFKSWLKSGDTTKPVAGQTGTVVLTASDLKKFDTISSSTNLLTTENLSVVSSRKKRKKRKTNKSVLDSLKEIVDVYGCA